MSFNFFCLLILKLVLIDTYTKGKLILGILYKQLVLYFNFILYFIFLLIGLYQY